MKYIFIFAMLAITSSGTLLAHDGSGHVEVAWYQEVSLLYMLIVYVFVGVMVAGGSYYLPKYRRLFAGVGVASLLFGLVGVKLNQTIPTPVAESVATSLAGVPVTVYRTEGCTCCSGFAKELSTTGADVVVETITTAEMHDLKDKYDIATNQESCHTSLMEGYVVEGHVPFEVLAKLVDERPAILGITLPGMPIGTPGMPGKQTEVYRVMTLGNELFWQSS